MSNKIEKLLRKPFLKHVAVLAGGTAASQAIVLAFSPITTRLFGPEAYGIQSVFMTVVNILAAVVSLSYPNAIVLPKTDDEAISLAKLSIFIGLVTSLALLPVFYLAGSEILTLLNAEQASGFVYLIPFAVFISVLVAVPTQWLIRKKRFALASKVSVIMSMITASTKAGLGTLYPSALCLILINTSSGILYSAMLYFGWKRSRVPSEGKLEIYSGSIGSYLKVARKYKDFALLRTPQGLLNIISQGAPIIFLSAYFSPSSVGFFSIATAVLSMPAAVVGGSVVQVFYPRVNEALHANEDIFPLLLKATVGMAVLGVFPFGVLGLLGPKIFSIVFGLQWTRAGEYCQWLSIGLFFVFINRPALSAIPVLRKQGVLLGHEIISLLLKSLALYYGFQFLKNDVAAIALFSFTTGVMSIILTFYVLIICRRHDCLVH